MAPNSGFAILLRSPWWVSFAIAAVIVLLCGALLPAHLAPFAAVGALPVAVIGCIAGWRQWRRIRMVVSQAGRAWFGTQNSKVELAEYWAKPAHHSMCSVTRGRVPRVKA